MRYTFYIIVMEILVPEIAQKHSDIEEQQTHQHQPFVTHLNFHAFWTLRRSVCLPVSIMWRFRTINYNTLGYIKVDCTRKISCSLKEIMIARFDWQVSNLEGSSHEIWWISKWDKAAVNSSFIQTAGPS